MSDENRPGQDEQPEQTPDAGRQGAPQTDAGEDGGWGGTPVEPGEQVSAEPRISLPRPRHWADRMIEERDAAYWLAWPFFNFPERRLRAAPRLVVFFLTVGIFAAVLMTVFHFLLPNAKEGSTLANFKGMIPLGISFVLAYLLCSWLVERRSLNGMGMSLNGLWWKDFAFGCFLGIFLMGAIFVLELSLGWIKVTGYLTAPKGSFWTEFLLMLGVFISVGFYEEIFSRGFHLHNQAEAFNPGSPLGARISLGFAVFISSSLFGWLHHGNPNATAMSTFNIVLAGIFLAVGYILTRSLAIPIGLHITWNLFQGNVFGFPVSGTDAGATVIAVHQGGPPLWTGGKFGPEAGLLGIAAMIAGALLIWAYVRLTRGKGNAGIKWDIAEYDRNDR